MARFRDAVSVIFSVLFWVLIGGLFWTQGVAAIETIIVGLTVLFMVALTLAALLDRPSSHGSGRRLKSGWMWAGLAAVGLVGWWLYENHGFDWLLSFALSLLFVIFGLWIWVSMMWFAFLPPGVKRDYWRRVYGSSSASRRYRR
jgi:hypothetical protein